MTNAEPTAEYTARLESFDLRFVVYLEDSLEVTREMERQNPTIPTNRPFLWGTILLSHPDVRATHDTKLFAEQDLGNVAQVLGNLLGAARSLENGQDEVGALVAAGQVGSTVQRLASTPSVDWRQGDEAVYNACLSTQVVAGERCALYMYSVRGLDWLEVYCHASEQVHLSRVDPERFRMTMTSASNHFLSAFLAYGAEGTSN